ncbi:MAG: TetR family transcriptional regulator [Bacillales bacterium]|jgi:AcrR family transcriptional regulator|nr:TetR family transcriptional regulator [Bacillales bacterium]
MKIEKFENLSDEKREAIINAAMSEFALKGYVKASTNEITKAANISKGLLFHYFKNKKLLFLYLFDFAVDYLTKEYFKTVELTDRDLLNRFEQAMKFKMVLIQQYPSMFKFIEVAYADEANEVYQEIMVKHEKYMELALPIFQNIDKSLFRNQEDIDKQIQMIYWTVEGVSLNLAKKIKDTTKPFEELYKELAVEAMKYMKLIRKIYYK